MGEESVRYIYEVVFGNTIEKNLVHAELHVSSRVGSLSTCSVARDGLNPD